MSETKIEKAILELSKVVNSQTSLQKWLIFWTAVMALAIIIQIIVIIKY